MTLTRPGISPIILGIQTLGLKAAVGKGLDPVELNPHKIIMKRLKNIKSGIKGAMGILFLVFLAELPETVMLGAESRESVERTISVENAALYYYQAFIHFPNDDQINAETVHQIAVNAGIGNLDQRAEQVLDVSYVALELLKTGSQSEFCDWGVTYGRFPGFGADTMRRCESLAQLAVTRARFALRADKPDEAEADITAILRLAKHAGRDGLLSNLSTQYSLEAMAFQVIAQHIAEFKTQQLIRFQDELASFSNLSKQEISQAIRRENEVYIVWAMNQVRNLSIDSDDKFKQLKVKLKRLNFMSASRAQTPNELLWTLEEMKTFLNKAAEITALPRDEFEKQKVLFAEKFKQNPVLQGYLAPDLTQTYYREVLLNLQRSLVRAALALQLKDSVDFRKIKDPYVDENFRKIPLKIGFRIESALKINGQPIWMDFGTHVKKTEEVSEVRLD